MTDPFDLLKKNRKTNFDVLAQEIAKTERKNYQSLQDDDRFWYPSVDKAGNGYAVVRFLPPTQGENVPFVTWFSHAFDYPKDSKQNWYIENSLTSKGLPDPCTEYNTMLWAAGNKGQASHQRRNQNYVSNVYIVEDSEHPENNGKVKLMKYGAQLFEFIKRAQKPEFKGEVAFDPFDLWEGANLQIKIRKKDGRRNYESSTWTECGPLLDDDEELKKVWLSQHKIEPFVADDQFKDYDTLKNRLMKVLGLDSWDINGEKKSAPKKTAAQRFAEVDEEQEQVAPSPKQKAKPAAKHTHVEDDDDDFDISDIEKALAGDDD